MMMHVCVTFQQTKIMSLTDIVRTISKKTVSDTFRLKVDRMKNSVRYFVETRKKHNNKY